MKRCFLLLLLALVILPACWPWKEKHSSIDSIIETKHISDIYNYITESEYNRDTLVMFDLDNTLITPPAHSDLGSDQWFYALFQRELKEGLTEQEAINTILPLYKQVIAYIDFVAVEHDTSVVVSSLQKRGISVIGLTARSLDLARRTVEQLAHIGIIFDKTDPEECPIKYGTGKPALYLGGIIFTGNYSKGEVVAAWLKQIDYKPKKIIFIDDKLKNVVSVEQALCKRNFPFYGLRYDYLDKRVKDFNWDKTQKELEIFLKKHPESRPIPAS
jgi:hypothetical protein